MKVKMQDAEISEYYKKFKMMYVEFSDAFSSDSPDIGRTKLITMDVFTRDSSPISHKPLKHATWVEINYCPCYKGPIESKR